MRLSPRDPRLGQWRNFMADAELGLGHHDAAIEQASMAIDAGYRTYFAYLNLALGTRSKARWMKQRRPWPKLAASIPSSA
jgi:hypothetical protein